jgi:subtilase family serine protease
MGAWKRCAGAAGLLLCIGLTVPVIPAMNASASSPGHQSARRSTAPVRRAHSYLSVRRVSATTMRASVKFACAANASSGYTPCNLRNAYELTTASTKDGKGVTIAVVDPYDDPSAAADLAVYRKAYKIAACTTKTKCFTEVNQLGQASPLPTPNQNDAFEISLDLDMVSAICPKCHILLVEANSNGLSDLGVAEDEAVTLGASVVSNSWGTGEFDGETNYDTYFDHPGVAITFSSGDGAYQGGVQYPSASPYVTSVGGTELTPLTKGARKWSETAWVNTSSDPPTQGSGSGCSAYELKPSWQTDSGCSNRTTADVSAVASDVLGYDSYVSGGGGWYVFAGTSVSSPIIAGTYALADNASSTTTPASLAYAHSSSLHDITSGSTGTCTPSYLCTAGPGYDGPTGLGSPDGIGAF